MVDRASAAAVADFSAPPEHWRLFKEGGIPVKVLPPRPPSGEYNLFGCAHSIGSSTSSSNQAEVSFGKLDKDERLFDPEASIRHELRRLHASLLASSTDILHCMSVNPEDHDRHVRHIRRLVQNLHALLQEARARESKALVLEKLREQVDRKRSFVAEAITMLPELEESAKDVGALAMSEKLPNIEMGGR